MVCLRCYEYDTAQELSAAIIGAVGDESMVMPMIGALRVTREENGIAENLLRLHRRHAIDREPYFSAIREAIADKKVGKYNRIQLINVMEAITGRSFPHTGPLQPTE